jgi:hypothetical protein
MCRPTGFARVSRGADLSARVDQLIEYLDVSVAAGKPEGSSSDGVDGLKLRLALK